jgi:hypothetical protein
VLRQPNEVGARGCDLSHVGTLGCGRHLRTFPRIVAHRLQLVPVIESNAARARRELARPRRGRSNLGGGACNWLSAVGKRLPMSRL